MNYPRTCKRFYSAVLLLAATLLVPPLASAASGEHAKGYLVDVDEVRAVRAALDSGEAHPLLVRARDALIELAQAEMQTPIRPVTHGKDENPDRIAPSGDPRDYVSLSPYWWPDPETKTGKPYVRRDGRINPERHEYDTPKMGAMGRAVRLLAFAYAVTGEERYAERAADHLRAWYVEPSTRMNPSMRFAQFVPGVSPGRPVGIIDTNRMRWVPDSTVLLVGSPHWSESDHRAVQRWFAEYAGWLRTSDLGLAESRADNNHGTWYDAQLALASLHGGDVASARRAVESCKSRIDQHIDAEGNQPHELDRTRSLDYVEFNLRGMLDLARYSERVGVDLAGYTGPEGESIRLALDRVLPALVGREPWPHEQISPPRTHMYFQTLRQAARLYDDPTYERAIAELGGVPDSILWVDLVLPPRHGPAAVGVADGTSDAAE